MRRADREIIDISDIESIITKSDVCRIAFADGNTPYIVTMNFGYSGGENKCLFFHCAKQGRKLDLIKKNNYVCFEMDTDHELYGGEKGCDWGMKYSSVIGYGKISVLTDTDAKTEGLNYLMTHYSGHMDFSYNKKVFDQTLVLRLEIEKMTGKRK